MNEKRIDELDELLGAMRDQMMSDEQMVRLDRLLADDAEAQRYYLDFVGLCAELRQYYGVASACDLPPAAANQEAQIRRWPRVATAVALAATVAVAASLITVFLTPEPRLPLSVVAEKNGVAVLTRVADAVWAEGSMPAEVGTALQPGTLKLVSGLAQVEFYSGAAVVLEGPAEFQVVSAQRGVFHRGKVRAHVPPQARGFTIGAPAPAVDVVDLGTEFALSVDDSGRTEVHVFDGEVRLKDAANGTETHRLTTGQGMRLSTGGEPQVIQADERSFANPARLVALADQTLERRREQWVEFSRQLAQDPTVLLYYTFEGQRAWDRTVRNEAGPRVGAIVGARWSEGRWPGKGALEFKRTSDRVRFNLPGRHDAMTFSAWVRFDGFDRWLSALLLTDGWEQGEPHWQVSWDGEIILGVRTGPKGGVNYWSPKGVLGPADLGRWVHLATVYDRAASRVTHYVDGRAVETIARPAGGEAISAGQPLIPLALGAAEIGNWSSQSIRYNEKAMIRNLNGRIDELALFGRALAEQDVKTLYESGRPQQ